MTDFEILVQADETTAQASKAVTATLLTPLEAAGFNDAQVREIRSVLGEDTPEAAEMMKSLLRPFELTMTETMTKVEEISLVVPATP